MHMKYAPNVKLDFNLQYPFKSFPLKYVPQANYEASLSSFVTNARRVCNAVLCLTLRQHATVNRGTHFAFLQLHIQL